MGRSGLMSHVSYRTVLRAKTVDHVSDIFARCNGNTSDRHKPDYRHTLKQIVGLRCCSKYKSNQFEPLVLFPKIAWKIFMHDFVCLSIMFLTQCACYIRTKLQKPYLGVLQGDSLSSLFCPKQRSIISDLVSRWTDLWKEH